MARRHRKFLSLLGNFLLCGLLLALVPLLPAAESAPDYLWWHFEGQQRTRDGGVTAAFTLRGADALDIDSLEFFYTTDRLRAYHAGVGVETARERTAWRKRVPVTTRTLTLYGGHYEQLELWAVARAGDRLFVTQTALNLYGDSGLEKNDFERLAAPPDIPGLNLNRQRGFYAAMTGEPLTFSLSHLPPGPLRVLLEGEKIAELRPEETLYRYVPPRNRKLTGKALLQYRDLIFLPEMTEITGLDSAAGAARDVTVRFSCCLPLYRSMRDNLDFPWGLTLLTASVALSLGAVLWKGRSFPWR